MITIDCTCMTPKKLHRELAKALNFPDWYGMNLDALYDCLTETQGELCLVGCTEDNFPGFSETFQDAANDNPEVTVTFL